MDEFSQKFENCRQWLKAQCQRLEEAGYSVIFLNLNDGGIRIQFDKNIAMGEIIVLTEEKISHLEIFDLRTPTGTRIVNRVDKLSIDGKYETFEEYILFAVNVK
jgi:hypothetical protein